MTVTLIDHYTGVGSFTSTNNMTITMTNAVAVGDMIVLGTCRTATASNSGVNTLTTIGTNTWQVNVANSTRASNYDIGLHLLPVTQAIGAGQVITITHTTVANRKTAIIGVFRGLTNATGESSGSYVGPGNVSGGSTGNSTVPFATVATPVAFAHQTMIGLISYNGVGYTPSSDVAVDTVLTTAGSAERGIVMTWGDRTNITDGDSNSRSMGGTYASTIVWAAAAVTLPTTASALSGSVVIGGAKKAVSEYSVVIGGAKKTVSSLSVVIGGAKKPLA